MLEDQFVTETKKNKPECCGTDRRQTGRTDCGTDGQRHGERRTSQDSPPVAVVGGNVAAAHSHTFVVVGLHCLKEEGREGRLMRRQSRIWKAQSAGTSGPVFDFIVNTYVWCCSHCSQTRPKLSWVGPGWSQRPLPTVGELAVGHMITKKELADWLIATDCTSVFEVFWGVFELLSRIQTKLRIKTFNSNLINVFYSAVWAYIACVGVNLG